MHKMNRKSRSLWTALIVMAVAWIAVAPQQVVAQSRTKKVQIKKPDDHIRLKNYRITNVVDARGKSSIGYMTTYSTNKFLAASLEKSVQEEVSDYIAENVEGAASGEEVALHVKQFFISEEMPAGSMAKIRFRMQLALFNKKQERLLDASFIGEKFTGPTRGAFIGQLMGNGMEELLKELDGNLPKALTRYKDPAPLPVWIVLNNAPEDKNLLPYSTRKPINLANFAGKAPAAATNIAGTNCGFVLDYQIRDMGGVLKAVIEIVPYFKQSEAWIKSGVDIRQAGAYGQNHFDIAAVITCDLVDAIDKKKFTFATLKNELEALRTEYEQKLKAEIDKQIAETGGGHKVDPLEDWIEKIEYEMKSVDCY